MVILLIILISVSGVLILKSVFTDWSTDDIKTEETIKTDLGDEFIFKYDYSDFPDSQTIINIIDKNNSKDIAYFVIEEKPNKTDLIIIINTTKIRCYEVYNNLIYKVNNDNFTRVDIDHINELDPVDYQSFVQVCNILIDKNEWKWIEVCAEFLINSGNSDIINRLQNYANGKFTQEEIEINKNSDITKEDIQLFSKQLLQD